MRIAFALGEPTSVVEQAGYSLLHLCRNHWERMTASDVVREPVSGTVLLEPDWEPQDCRLSHFATSGGGIYSEARVAALVGHLALVQGEVAQPTIGVRRLDSLTRYGRDQCFALHLYLYAAPSGLREEPWVRFHFGGRYAVELGSNGMGSLLRSQSRRWTDGREPRLEPIEPMDYWPVARGRLLPDGLALTGGWRTLTVLSLGHGTLVVKGAEDLGLVYREEDVLEEGHDPETGSYTAAHATFAAPVRVDLNCGAFALNLSVPHFATRGLLTSPVFHLGYTATQAPTARVCCGPGEGVSAAVALLPGSGGSLALPTDHFAYQVTLTGPADRPTVLHDVQVDFPQSREDHEAALTDLSGYLLELRESRSLDDGCARLTAVLDDSARELTGLFGRSNLDAVVACDGARRFTGSTSTAALLEGKGRRLALGCEDRGKRLRHALLTDDVAFDGLAHTEAVRRLLRAAGLRDEEMAIAEDDTPLPARVGGDDPRFQPRNGETVAAFLEYLRESFSGWRAGFDREGVFHYEPPSDALSPVAAFATTSGDEPGILPMLDLARTTDESGFANEVHVLGRTASGEVLSACFLDWASQNEPGTPRYIGERRLMVWIDTALATQAAVNWVCRTLAEEAMHLRRFTSFSAPFVAEVYPGDRVLVGEEPHTVRGMETTHLPRSSRTRYVCEPDGE